MCSPRRSNFTSLAMSPQINLGKMRVSSRKRRNHCLHMNSKEKSGCCLNIPRAHRRLAWLPLFPCSLFYCPLLYFVWKRCRSSSTTKCSIRPRMAPKLKKTKCLTSPTRSSLLKLCVSYGSRLNFPSDFLRVQTNSTSSVT
uniref:Uncharacterized protein n=1 Tax=Cacopsylla melanoneura TaxID=428564 RepID=A0A8D8TTS5_9HEMI